MRERPLATIGVIGCGAISDVYFAAIARSPALILASVAARRPASAERQAARYGGRATTVDAMLADPAIDLVVNLTPSALHHAVNRRILEAGKHLYTEKPLVLTAAEARELARLAEEKCVRIGGAPDTLFGAAHQAARALVDEGAVGRIVHGACFTGISGIELFHPNPAGFYRPGSEPPYEIGPYYITQLINLLGPVTRVTAMSARGPDERPVRVGPRAGDTFPVEVPTSFGALLGFENGAFVGLTMSLDVTRQDRAPMELYGTAGSLKLVDPNFFGGVPAMALPGGDWATIDLSGRPLRQDNRAAYGGRVADYRGAGLIEMVVAIDEGRPHRLNASLVTHCVEVMEAVIVAARTGDAIAIASRCERPLPIDPVRDARFLSLVRSPHEPVGHA